jgi:hypothetical protein
MLYLNPPFPIIRGVSLFRDHLDPLQWYYMPVSPRLSQINDAATGKSRPALQLIKFRGDAGGGGFLNFDVNVGVGEDVLDDIKAELRSPQFRLPPGSIQLSPVPLTGGTVKLLLLGQESSPPPRPAASPAPSNSSAAAAPTLDPTLPRFVTRISHEAHPALYLDNQAAFSVMLDEAGVTLLEQALQGNMAPIAVVYALDYLALRPAYNVHLRMDWDRIQKHMDEHFGVNTLFTSIDIDKAVDELVENRAIVLEADTFVPEGEDTAGIISNRDRALNEVRDMITDAFFTSSIDPVKPRSDDWDKATRTAARVATIVATGGWAGIGTFSYKKFDYKRVDRKVLDVTMRERTTVKRSIYPQGHLTGLFQVLRDQNLKISDFVTAVSLNDPWFQKRRVTVIPRVDWSTDSVSSLNVTLRYGADTRNLILDKSTPSKEVVWLSRLHNGVMERDVIASYRVNFQGVDTHERPVTLQSPEQTVRVENLEINPRELYSIVMVPVTVPAAGFPWARYPLVEAHLRYHDAARALHQQQVFLLTKEKPDDTWPLFVLQRGDVPISYRLIYRAADNRDYTTPWTSTLDQQVIVRDPFPQKRTVTVVPAVDWNIVDQIFVDFDYEDAPNNFRVSESINLTESDRASKTFSVDLRNPSARRVAYSVTILFKDGQVAEIPQSHTLEPRVFVRADMRGRRIVTVSAPRVDFAARKIARIQVDLRYLDREAGLRFDGSVTLNSHTDTGSFEYDYVDLAKPRYEYRVTIFFLNGMTREKDWQPTAAPDLSITEN